jgi:hypothetical protein
MGKQAILLTRDEMIIDVFHTSVFLLLFCALKS